MNVAEHIVTAVIPHSELHQQHHTTTPLPVTALPDLPRDDSMLYRIASVDHRGRVAESSVVKALAWSPSDSLHVGTCSGAVVCRRAADGASILTKRGHIPLPLSVRAWAGLTAGERVLLAAAPELDVLMIHTMAALDAMVLDYHASLTVEVTS